MEQHVETIALWVAEGSALVKRGCLTRKTRVVFQPDVYVYLHPRQKGEHEIVPDDFDVWEEHPDGTPSPWGVGRVVEENMVIALTLDIGTAPVDTTVKPIERPTLSDTVFRNLEKIADDDTLVKDVHVTIRRSANLWSRDILDLLDFIDNHDQYRVDNIRVTVLTEVVIPANFYKVAEKQLPWSLFDKREDDILSQPMDDDEFRIKMRELERQGLLATTVNADEIWEELSCHVRAGRLILVPRPISVYIKRKRIREPTVISKCIDSLKNTLTWIAQNAPDIPSDDAKFEAMYTFLEKGYLPFAAKMGLADDNEDVATDSDEEKPLDSNSKFAPDDYDFIRL